MPLDQDRLLAAKNLLTWIEDGGWKAETGTVGLLLIAAVLIEDDQGLTPQTTELAIVETIRQVRQARMKAVGDTLRPMLELAHKLRNAGIHFAPVNETLLFIFRKYGASCLKEVNPKHYPAVIKDGKLAIKTMETLLKRGKR